MYGRSYPATLTSENDESIVTFRDIPEAIAQGFSILEAKENAADVLSSAMDFYFEDGRMIPEPSELMEGEVYITLSEDLTNEIYSHNERVRNEYNISK